MGSFFNRGSPDRPNIRIKFMDLDGKEKRVPVGRVNRLPGVSQVPSSSNPLKFLAPDSLQ